MFGKNKQDKLPYSVQQRINAIKAADALQSAAWRLRSAIPYGSPFYTDADKFYRQATSLATAIQWGSEDTDTLSKVAG